MDAISQVMALLTGGFLMWGAYICGFCRDRRSANPTPRARANRRRAGDVLAAVTQPRRFEIGAQPSQRIVTLP